MDPEFDPIPLKQPKGPGLVYRLAHRVAAVLALATHPIAVLTAGLTLLLLFAGGLVTTYRVGMAVPDWPTTFGENMVTFDLWNAAFGVRVEHIHRLAGMTVGICTILLMLDFLAFDRRKSAKLLGVLALAAVIAQGVLGGMRVRNNSTLLAMVHGCTGQAFFAFMVALATITGRSWFAARHTVEESGRMKGLAVATLAVAYLQIVLGAWLRHFLTPAALMSHAGLAVLVVATVAATIRAVRRRRADVPGLLGPIRAIEVSLAVQLALGIASWWLLRPFDGIAHPIDTAQALVRTGHQANAALLLGAVLVLNLRLFGRAAGRPLDEPTPELVAEGPLWRLGVVR